jgi:hypothetical protein
MSNCPTHNVPAVHAAVVVGWHDPTAQFVFVEHRCPVDSVGWLESAKDPDAVLARVGLCRIKEAKE